MVKPLVLKEYGCPDVTTGPPPGGVRDALSRHRSGAAILTTCDRGEPSGLLVGSLAVLPGTPSRISFHVPVASYGWPALDRAEHVGVHLLSAGQQQLAGSFRARTVDGLPPEAGWEPGPFGVPLLAGCAAWLVVRPRQRVHAGAAVIVVADVLSGAAAGPAPVLLEAV